MSGVIINSLYFLYYIYNKIYKYVSYPSEINENNNEVEYYQHHNMYKLLYCEKLLEMYNKTSQYKLIHKSNFSNCLRDICNKNNIIYWIYNNNIRNLLKYKLVVLDFQVIYDYENKKELRMDYLKNLSKYLLNNKIIFCIISEINPKYFPKLEYFNSINLVTPYHYKTQTFGGVVKIGINKYNDKSVEVSLNKIIIDIMNQYGCNEEEIVYINSKKIDNINTIII